MFFQKIKKTKGYMLFESIVSLSVLSFSLIVLIPFVSRWISDLKNAEKEVEYWRIAKDQMQILNEGVTLKEQISSDGQIYQTSWDPENNVLTISNNQNVIIEIGGTGNEE